MNRVALIGENSIEYIDKLIDIWNAGDCAVLIDFRVPFETAVQMMYEAGVRTCYIEKKLFSKCVDKIPEDIVFNYYEKTSSSVGFLPEYIYDKFSSNYSNSEAVVIYSSGTTGKSKGIILSHYAINTNANAIIDYFQPDKIDYMYMIKTISHSSSITGELLVALKTHTKLLMSPIIVPPRYTLSNIKKYGITKICINPTLLRIYIDECKRNLYKLTSLKEIYVHGAKASEDLCRLACNYFDNANVYFEYGLSEAGPRVASQKISAKNVDSVGKAVKDVEITVVDETGSIVKSEHCGIIHVKTPSRFSGYISGNEKFMSLHKDWLNTGDIGYFDKDNELHVVDRVDDVINMDAHKIYPSEIEKTMLDFSGISECAVVKVKYKNNEFIGCLYVGNYISEQEIRDMLKNRLPTYEIPRRFIQCGAIPRTLNGKISKADIRAKILDAIETE